MIVACFPSDSWKYMECEPGNLLLCKVLALSEEKLVCQPHTAVKVLKELSDIMAHTSTGETYFFLLDCRHDKFVGLLKMNGNKNIIFNKCVCFCCVREASVIFFAIIRLL